MLIINKKENKIFNMEFISKISVEPIFRTTNYEIVCRVDNGAMSIKSFFNKTKCRKRTEQYY